MQEYRNSDFSIKEVDVQWAITIQSRGGTVSLGNANNFGILSGLAYYLLTLKPKGIREPHTS